MADQSNQTVDTVLCFDANLPQLERCKDGCENRDGILCSHRFDFKIQIEYCNTPRFNGWPDLRILYHFLGYVFECIAKGVADPGKCTFILLTKDRNFVDDVRREWKEIREEWEKTGGGMNIDLNFCGNFIFCGGLKIFVQQIDCPNYGNHRSDDLKCAFQKVNTFLSQKT